MMEDDQPLRPTGRMERFNIMRHALHMYNTVHVSALYTIPSSSLPKLSISSPAAFQTLIFTCLASVIADHPILGVTIQDEASTTPTYRRLQTIDLTQIVKIIEQDPEAHPDAWLQAGLRERLDRVDELPVWRVIVAVEASSFDSLKSSDADLKFRLAFFGHHVIADGISCGAFHVSFLAALNALIASPSSSSSIFNSTSGNGIVAVPKKQLVPCLEENATLPLTLWYMICIIFAEYIYSPTDLLSWSGPPIFPTPPTAPPSVVLNSFSLPPTQVAALVSRCRAEGTTVTGLLLVLTARILGEMYPSHTHFIGGMPFSVRKFTGHSERDMGVYLTGTLAYFSSSARAERGWIACAATHPGEIKLGAQKYKHKYNSEELWDGARKAKEHIRKLTSSPANQAVAMLRFIDDYQPFFRKRLGAERESAFEVSNIGVVVGAGKGEGEGEAWFDGALFCGGLSMTSAPFVVTVVSVKGGEMGVCVTYEEGVVSPEEAGRMVEGLEGGLKVCSGVWEM